MPLKIDKLKKTFTPENMEHVTYVNPKDKTVYDVQYIRKSNGDYLWCHPYELTSSIDEGIESLVIKRTSTYEPTAPKNDDGTPYIFDRDAEPNVIYQGDVITATPKAKAGYLLDSTTYATIYTCNESNISINPRTSLEEYSVYIRPGIAQELKKHGENYYFGVDPTTETISKQEVTVKHLDYFTIKYEDKDAHTKKITFTFYDGQALTTVKNSVIVETTTDTWQYTYELYSYCDDGSYKNTGKITPEGLPIYQIDAEGLTFRVDNRFILNTYEVSFIDATIDPQISACWHDSTGYPFDQPIIKLAGTGVGTSSTNATLTDIISSSTDTYTYAIPGEDDKYCRTENKVEAVDSDGKITEKIKSKTTVKGYFTESLRNYTIKWWGGNDDVLEVDENVHYDDALVYDGGSPWKKSTDKYSYSFKDFYCNGKVVDMISTKLSSLGVGYLTTGTTTVNIQATFNQSIRTYSLTLALGGSNYGKWEDKDGNVVTQTAFYEYGTAVKMSAGVITIKDDTYKFVNDKDIAYDYSVTFSTYPSTIVGEATITATTSRTRKAYTATFEAGSYGSWDYSDYTINYGDILKNEAHPTDSRSYVVNCYYWDNPTSIKWTNTYTLDEDDDTYRYTSELSWLEITVSKDVTITSVDNQIYKGYIVKAQPATYVSEVWLSTKSVPTSSADLVPSGTSFRYGQNVFFFIKPYDNDAQYTYTVESYFAKIDSLGLYRVGGVTVQKDYDAGKIGSVSRTLNSYTVTYYLKYGSTTLATDTATKDYGSIVKASDKYTTDPYITSSYVYSGLGNTDTKTVTGNISVTATYSTRVDNAYTVTYQAKYIGSIISSKVVSKVKYGTKVSSDTYYGSTYSHPAHDYSGGTFESATVTGDTTVTTTYADQGPLKSYTVYYEAQYDGTGEVIARTSQIQLYGTSVSSLDVYPSSYNPGGQYSYTFGTGETGTVTSEGQIFVTTYSTRTTNTYSITFKATNGSWSDTPITADYGTAITRSGNVVTIGSRTSTFTPYKTTLEYNYGTTVTYTGPSTITGNATYTGSVEKSVRKYDINWLDGDETTVLQHDGNMVYGEILYYSGCSAIPTKEETDKYTYTFSTWAMDGFGPVTSGETKNPGSLTTTALDIQSQFIATVKNYTITFSSNYGSWSTTSFTVPYGTSVSRSGNVVTVGSKTTTFTPQGTTEQYNFTDATFSNITQVTGDTTYTAIQTRSTRYYTIEWVMDDYDTVLETDSNVAYGDIVNYNGSTPTKASTAEFDYTFNEWWWLLGGVTVVPGKTKCIGSTTSTTLKIAAAFEATARIYDVTYQAVYKGSVVASEVSQLKYGQTADSTSRYPESEYSDTPGYRYAEGTKETKTVTGNTTVSTTYTKKQFYATFETTSSVTCDVSDGWFESGYAGNWIITTAPTTTDRYSFSNSDSDEDTVPFRIIPDTNTPPTVYHWRYVTIENGTDPHCTTSHSTGWLLVGTVVTWTADSGSGYQYSNKNNTLSTTISHTVQDDTSLFGEQFQYLFYYATISNSTNSSSDKSTGWYLNGTTITFTATTSTANTRYSYSNAYSTTNTWSTTVNSANKSISSGTVYIWRLITISAKYGSTTITSTTAWKLNESTVYSSAWYNNDPWNYDTQYQYSGKTTNSITVSSTVTSVSTVYSTRTLRSYTVTYGAIYAGACFAETTKSVSYGTVVKGSDVYGSTYGSTTSGQYYYSGGTSSSATVTGNTSVTTIYSTRTTNTYILDLNPYIRTYKRLSSAYTDYVHEYDGATMHLYVNGVDQGNVTDYYDAAAPYGTTWKVTEASYSKTGYTTSIDSTFPVSGTVQGYTSANVYFSRTPNHYWTNINQDIDNASESTSYGTFSVCYNYPDNTTWLHNQQNEITQDAGNDNDVDNKILIKNISASTGYAFDNVNGATWDDDLGAYVFTQGNAQGNININYKKTTWSYTVNQGDYVSSWRYKIDSGSWTTCTLSNFITGIPSTSTLYVEYVSGTDEPATTQYTYTMTTYNGSFSRTSANAGGSTTIYRTATPVTRKYTVSVSGSYCKSYYLSTSSTATSGSASGSSFDYGSTVYYFATLNDDSAQYYYYAPSSWTLISGRTYRAGSIKVTGGTSVTVNAYRATQTYRISLPAEEGWYIYSGKVGTFNYGDTYSVTLQASSAYFNTYDSTGVSVVNTITVNGSSKAHRITYSGTVTGNRTISVTARTYCVAWWNSGLVSQARYKLPGSSAWTYVSSGAGQIDTGVVYFDGTIEIYFNYLSYLVYGSSYGYVSLTSRYGSSWSYPGGPVDDKYLTSVSGCSIGASSSMRLQDGPNIIVGVYNNYPYYSMTFSGQYSSSFDIFPRYQDSMAAWLSLNDAPNKYQSWYGSGGWGMYVNDNSAGEGTYVGGFCSSTGKLVVSQYRTNKTDQISLHYSVAYDSIDKDYATYGDSTASPYTNLITAWVYSGC